MAKINKDEYEILKGLDSKWKWIARDENSKKSTFPNELWLYEYKTIKGFNHWLGGGGATERFRYNNLFQFIKWRDKEPHNIQELIEEYESEETEVKKNIEWLKEKVDDLQIYSNPDVPKDRNDLYTQYVEGVNDAVRQVKVLVGELDEPEVLSQEWIDEHKWVAKDTKTGVVDYAVADYDLQNLLVPTLSEMETVEITEEQVMEWLDNNDFYDHATAETVLANAVDKDELGYYGTKYSVVEKPVIPKFVADWIERNRDRYENQLFLIGHDFYNNCIPPNVDDWLMDNEEKFMRAWLDGYMTEDEPKFVIDLDDEEISDGNHYLKRLEMSIDSVNVVAGDSLNSMTFESEEEEAQLIADYVGGRVKELEE